MSDLPEIHAGSLVVSRNELELLRREPLDELAVITAERDALADALQRLIAAKEEKDANGKSPRYYELREGVWERAKDSLMKVVFGKLFGEL